MDISKLIKFEPIDLTQIIITVVVLGIVIYAFKTQLDSFFASLENRPITVQMSGAETTIKLDAPVSPSILTTGVANPSGTDAEIHDWEQTVNYIDSIEGFQKLGFSDLYSKLTTIGPNEYAVLNYTVNDQTKRYFNDESMLKYLSIASEKVRYLAFYERGKFVGAIKIQAVISGLASNNHRFQSFGEKVRSGEWVHLPGIIKEDSSFKHTPSIKELHEYLADSKLSEVPLLQDNILVGFLNYESISKELYTQAEGI